MVGLGNVDNTSDIAKPTSTATQLILDLKAPLLNPQFTGTNITGITKSMVGLGNVDNTTDLTKPISTATQTALNLLAPLANPKFTGTISGNTNFSVDATGNLTAYSLTSNNNITCTDVLYAGGTSLATKIGTLAPYTGGSSFQAGTITSLTNITSPSLQINGNATITGDILLGLPQVYLSTTLNGKANLSGATFTGQITTPNLLIPTGGQFATKSGISTTSAIDSFGNITSYGGSIAMMNGGSTKFYCDSNGNVSNSGTLTTTGTIAAPTINLNGTSIATSLAACAQKTSGSFASTATFQTIYTPVNQRGFIYVGAGPPCYSTAMAFFEALTGYSYGSLTLLAQSGNAAQGVLNTSSAATGGIVNVFLQWNGNIQVRTSTACTVQWFIMNF